VGNGAPGQPDVARAGQDVELAHMKERRLVAALLVLVSSTSLAACPIRRPAVPTEYFGFRADLETAVADTSVSVMSGETEMQQRLYGRLPELSAIVSTDSLIATLQVDTVIESLAGPIEATLTRALGADGVGGTVRKAFKKPDGQRLAVDGIIVGLGKALRRLGFEPAPNSEGD
jgi:hypothetical protein